MIDYTLFYFSCPPCTGGAWFLEACRLAGFGPRDESDAWPPFPAEKTADKFRVSLVRHPCNWLAECYDAIGRKDPCIHLLTPFRLLRLDTFERFVGSYLDTVPGGIGRLYNRYMADACIRVEDLPWAFVELLTGLRAPKAIRDRCSKLSRPDVSDGVLAWNKSLRRRVCVAEADMMDRYDYFS